MTVDVKALRHAQALEEFASFSRAADELGVAQPTLSRSIQALEASLGVRLFDRGPRGVAPTAAGRLFLSHASRVLEDLTELEREIERFRAVEIGSLDVGVGLLAANHLLGPALARLASRQPRLRVFVHAHPWHRNVARLRSGEIEILLGEPSEAVLDPELEVEVLSRERVVAICRAGHPLLAEGTTELKSVLRYPLAAPVLPSFGRRWLWEGAKLRDEDELQRMGIPAIECEHPEVLKQIVMGSDVVGLTVGSAIGSEYAAGRLEILSLSTPPPRKEYALIRLAGQTPSPAASAFVACARAVATELMGASLADYAAFGDTGPRGRGECDPGG